MRNGGETRTLEVEPEVVRVENLEFTDCVGVIKTGDTRWIAATYWT